jgi:hypothetical protein
LRKDLGAFQKVKRWFLLNKQFGLRLSEIAEMEGLDKRSSSVRQLIIRVSDQLKSGEISLIKVTAEEAQAAKARLDAHNIMRLNQFDTQDQFPNTPHTKKEVLISSARPVCTC